MVQHDLNSCKRCWRGDLHITAATSSTVCIMQSMQLTVHAQHAQPHAYRYHASTNMMLHHLNHNARRR